MKVFIFLLFLLSSCNSFRSSKEEVKSLFGRKIITHIASSSCSDCALGILKYWSEINKSPH